MMTLSALLLSGTQLLLAQAMRLRLLQQLLVQQCSAARRQVATSLPCV
jgi:hypothetical protein